MSSRKHLYILISTIIFGLAHGYYIAMIKNKSRINEAYEIANSNYLYRLSEVKKITKQEGVDEAEKYIEAIIERNKRNYNDFLQENPKYIPLLERQNDIKN